MVRPKGSRSTYSVSHAEKSDPSLTGDLRAEFPLLQYIKAEEIYKRFDKIKVVDVRSPFEYETIHITGAINLDLSTAGFADRLKKVFSVEKKPLVFYCNGHQCRKSYEAGSVARKLGIKNAFVFDEGIFKWAQKFPTKTILLGETPAPLKFIPSRKELQKKSISFDVFRRRVLTTKEAVVIDVREPLFRTTIPNLPIVAREIGMGRLVKLLMSGQLNQRPLFIFDATGHQILWLEIHLRKFYQGPGYVFLEGGVDALPISSLRKISSGSELSHK
ncbi:rhodanese-like domain-containing protein [Chromobacterium haemolyticum]|uniref:Rhodanese domain-containing protein n=1 Tax=Chromobacterium haemolyticum TaxID=394935 RepID=A0A1W0C914_9NEIS|nr:rhodanese-like domain-containing protein [Chromobacterium haemolyticum]OQS31201.1 hypothetical protein B0T45_23185 [Chromobacterium haemolyticum]